jgi:hypothetical protein
MTTACRQNGRCEWNFFGFHEPTKKRLTFIKLEAIQMPSDCCIPETDSAYPLSYGCLGIKFIWASCLIGRFGDLKKRTEPGETCNE